MRTCTKEFTSHKYVPVTELATGEELLTIAEDKQLGQVVVTVGYKNAEGTILGTEELAITGDNYELLTAESPSFTPGKPANEYREADLWYIIDKMRS